MMANLASSMLQQHVSSHFSMNLISCCMKMGTLSSKKQSKCAKNPWSEVIYGPLFYFYNLLGTKVKCDVYSTNRWSKSIRAVLLPLQYVVRGKVIFSVMFVCSQRRNPYPMMHRNQSHDAIAEGRPPNPSPQHPTPNGICIGVCWHTDERGRACPLPESWFFPNAIYAHCLIAVHCFFHKMYWYVLLFKCLRSIKIRIFVWRIRNSLFQNE